MKLIAGLGNPGDKYKFTRHNDGFLVADYIAGSLKSGFDIKTSSYEALISKIDGAEFILLKPLTFINRSGEAISRFFNDFDKEISDILIIVDDFNIPLGSIRVRRKGSDGGHNGIADLIYQFGTDEFPRMRIGIGLDEPPSKDDYIDFVLGDFTQTEFETFNKMMPHYRDCVMSFITSGLLSTMNNFNKNFLLEQ